MASDAVVGNSAVEGEPTLIILCGLPGSGKSTLARRLANERPGVRFCPDDWMEALGVDLWDEAFRCRIEQLPKLFRVASSASMLASQLLQAAA